MSKADPAPCPILWHAWRLWGIASSTLPGWVQAGADFLRSILLKPVVAQEERAWVDARSIQSNESSYHFRKLSLGNKYLIARRW